MIALAADETLDRLSGEWWIYQLRAGQRYSTDDVLLAHAGWRARPSARQVLDLGAGVGSVGLLALQLLEPAARLAAVEIQQRSVALMAKTVAHNGLDGRVALRRGDLRDGALLDALVAEFAATAGFELILANPPYLRPDAALRSAQPQRAAARLELHGDIGDYCRAAARCLSPEGRFCFCHAAADPRPERAVAMSGLALLARQDVVFREGQPPTIALFCCGAAGARVDPPPHVVRGADDGFSDAHRAVRRALLIEA